MKTLMEARPNATFTSLILGLAAAASAIAADLKVPSDYPTIQAAVDAAQSNDTIRIASGVYAAQVKIISKKLTLIGQPGTILRATKEMTHFTEGAGGGPGHIPIMFVYLSEVTARGLTFEGERLAGHFVGDGDMIGLYFLRSSGNVESCAFYGFRENTPGPENAGTLWFLCSESDDINARVVGCTFADNYEGIFLLGGRIRKNITATIENNIIIGPGPVDTAISYAGIQMATGVGGRIAGNTISGFSYVGTTAQFPISFGILASDNPVFSTLPPLQIEGNTLRNNQMHIALTKAGGSVIRNNRFQGTAPGIAPLGVAVSGTNITIGNNQFEDLPEGIRLLGNEPLRDELPALPLGDILGFAVNAQVTSNHFCRVNTPINRQPPATATETGTLTNSCSSNALTIASAVFVSWPGDEDGWIVESATSVVGPWTPSDATPFLQRGQHSIAVPTDGAHRFFRLR